MANPSGSGIPRTRLVDDNGRTIKVDGNTDALAVIDYPHSEAHGGKRFLNTCVLALGLNDVVMCLFRGPTTANKEAHMTFAVKGGAEGNLMLYYGGSYNAASLGTVYPSFNHHLRYQGVTNPESVITTSMTVVVTGTLFFQGTFGSGRAAGETESREEIIIPDRSLANHFIYAGIKSLAADNNISWSVDWYEHTNRDL